METITLNKNSMNFRISFENTTSLHLDNFFKSSSISGFSSSTKSETISSTRFNNSERFSLEKLKNNKRKLESIKNLSSNWNGYGSPEIEEKLISKVQQIISNLEYQPQIFPTGRGSIQIEKHINDENFVEIEISNDEVFAYQMKNGVETEKAISTDEINNLISDLYA